MLYFIKSPWILRKFYSNCIWKIPVYENVMYLTFDDGPHPEATSFVLDCLRDFQAKATFFCIGKNVKEHPAMYKRILEAGHRTANHTFDHLNGWKVPDEIYIKNILKAAELIDSNLFRPPYGRITKFQEKLLSLKDDSNKRSFKLIMWDVISADFDTSLSGDKCAENVNKNASKGSIVVFHDSKKAFPRLKTALPLVLENFSKLGYKFEELPE